MVVAAVDVGELEAEAREESIALLAELHARLDDVQSLVAALVVEVGGEHAGLLAVAAAEIEHAFVRLQAAALDQPDADEALANAFKSSGVVVPSNSNSRGGTR